MKGTSAKRLKGKEFKWEDVPLSLDIRAEMEGTGICAKHTGCKTRWDLAAYKERKIKQLCASWTLLL